MTKKSSRKSTRSVTDKAPQAAQLDAIRKLLRSYRFDEALDRAEQLLARYPGFRPLLALCWEAADSAEEVVTAALYAWDWSRVSPGSAAAFEALRESAYAAGFAALTALAAQKLAQLQGEPLPELPPLRDVHGDISFSQAVASDLSRLYLSFCRYDDVVALLETEDYPAIRNNAALARFAQGKIAASLADVEWNWQRDAGNLFALFQVARLRLWTDGREAAGALLPSLRETEPLRAEDAHGKMFGMLLLGANDEVVAAWQALRQADFWSEFNVASQSACAHLAGMAAWRRGDTEAARELFAEALDLDPDNLNPEEASFALSLGAFARNADPKTGAFHDWLPQSWMIEYQAAKGADAALQCSCRLSFRCG